LAELETFRELATAAAKLSRKRSFLNGLEIRCPRRRTATALSPNSRSLCRLPCSRTARPSSPSH
jgi:hypothetical protein